MPFTKKSTSLPQPSLVDVIITDHRVTTALLQKFSEAAEAEDAQLMENLLDAISMEVRFHSQAEKDVLYPLLKKLKDGEAMQKHVLEEHSKIETDLLEALKLRKEGGEKLTEVMQHARKIFEDHIKEEEDSLLPQLLEEIKADELLDLATKMLESKEKAPLEPQP